MMSAPMIASNEALNDLSDYFHAAPIGLHVADPDGIITRTNLAELELLGFSHCPDEYVGHHLAEFHDDTDALRELLDRLIAGETIVEYETSLVRRDGKRQRVLLYANGRFDEKGFNGVRCFTFPHPDDLRPEIAELGALRDESIERRQLDLTAEERLQFSPDERCPPFHAELAPRLPDNAWPEERLQKVLRNYSMEYITSIVPETIAVLGPDEGGRLAGAAARLIGMHTFDEVAAILRGVEPGAAGFAAAFARLSAGQGDDARMVHDATGSVVRQTSWRLMSDRENVSPVVFDGSSVGAWCRFKAASPRTIRSSAARRTSSSAPRMSHRAVQPWASQPAARPSGWGSRNAGWPGSFPAASRRTRPSSTVARSM